MPVFSHASSTIVTRALQTPIFSLIDRGRRRSCFHIGHSGSLSVRSLGGRHPVMVNIVTRRMQSEPYGRTDRTSSQHVSVQVVVDASGLNSARQSVSAVARNRVRFALERFDANPF
jgi:hypothetical protein